MEMKKYMLIGIFGAAGSAARYMIGILCAEYIFWWGNKTDFPFGTLLVNLIGCLLLPFIFIRVREKKIISENLIVALGTGFVGGFTTFSAFTTDFVNLIREGRFQTAFIYVIITLVGGFAAAAFSMRFSLHLQKSERRGKEQ